MNNKKMIYKYKPKNKNELKQLIKNKNINLWDIDTSLIIDMSYLFSNNKKIKNIDGLKYWDVSNVINMVSLFSHCKNLKNINGISNWNISNVSNIERIFYGCNQLEDRNNILIGLNFSNIRNAQKAFYDTKIILDFRKLRFKDECLIKNLFDNKNIFGIKFSKFLYFKNLKEYSFKSENNKFINNVLLKYYLKNNKVINLIHKNRNKNDIKVNLERFE